MILFHGEDEAAAFHVYSCGGRADDSRNSWTLHAVGKVCLDKEGGLLASNGQHQTIKDMRARCLDRTSGQEYYSAMHQSGVQYGSFFQCIANLYRDKEDIISEIQIPERPEADFEVFRIHPGILDAGFQVFGAAVATGTNESHRQGLHLPTGIDQFRLYGRPGDRQWCHARVRQREAGATTGDVQLLDEAGGVAVEI